MARPKTIWSKALLEQLSEAYATTPNHVLAKQFNVSVSTIRRKAKDLNLSKVGLCKSKNYHQTWNLVKELFGEHSYNDIAKKAKVSGKTIARVAKRLGYKLLKEDRNRIIAIGTSKGLKSELRKRIFGLDTSYNRPIGKDKSRKEVAKQLVKHGYLVIKGSMTAYYNDTMERYEDIEKNAIANGFRLMQWTYNI